MSEAPFYYSYAVTTGRGILVDLFETEDPFAPPPAEIVERVLALGCTPVISRAQREPLPTWGAVSEVPRDDQTFLVAVSRDAETVSVQEVRVDAYLPLE